MWTALKKSIKHKQNGTKGYLFKKNNSIYRLDFFVLDVLNCIQYQ